MVTYSQIQRYSESLGTVTGNALRELRDSLSSISTSDPFTRAEAVRSRVARIAEKYGLSAQELGAQWYELCAQSAGVKVDPAIVGEVDYDSIYSRLDFSLDAYLNGQEDWSDAERKVLSLVEDVMRDLSRQSVLDNLDRDERQDRRSGGRSRGVGYARVPVGETCAWCYMLASLGYWYRSEQTALGPEPDHYHRGCDCVAVPYSDPSGIEGYDDYRVYLDMYRQAKDAWDSGDYSEDMAARIEAARQRHEERYEAGEDKAKWTDYNAVLMLMREQQGLEH